MNRFQWESSKKNNLRFGTKGPMRNSIIILISLTLLIGQWGCTHTIPEKSVVQPGPLADGVRTELRIIGIVSGRYKPECRFRSIPKGLSESASVGAAGGAIEGAMGGLLYPLTEPEALLFLPIVIPISVLVGTVAGALIGTITGASQGSPKSKVEEAEATIKNAINELKVQEVMRESILTISQEQTRYQFVVIDEQGPTAINDEPTYFHLDTKGIDAILEINVWSYGLWSEGGVNPSFRLFVNASVRLIQIRDGTVLFGRNVRRETISRKFIDWGANGAAEFTEGVHICCHSLARQIMRDLFN